MTYKDCWLTYILHINLSAVSVHICNVFYIPYDDGSDGLILLIFPHISVLFLSPIFHLTEGGGERNKIWEKEEEEEEEDEEEDEDKED